MKREPLAVLFSDTHLSSKNKKTNIDIYDQILQISKELKVDTIIHAGDIFESRKSQNLETLSIFKNILDEFESEKRTLYAIPGNHDKTDYESEESFLDPFYHHPALELYRFYGSFFLGEVRIHMVPFFDEKEVYFSNLDKHLNLSKKSKNILVTHVAISGVKNNDGSVVDNSLKSSVFKKFDKVLVGHYHNYSELGSNVIYFGSAFQHNFGEDEDKGCVIIYSNGDIERRRLNFPQYVNVPIDLEETTSAEIEAILYKYKTSTNNVRFEFRGDAESLASINKSAFRDLGVSVSFKSKNLEESIEKAENEEFVSFDDSSIIEEFELFCEENKVEDKDFGLRLLKNSLLKHKQSKES